MPYSMIEPIRELLDAGVQSDKQDTDMRWSQALKDEIMDVKVGLDATLVEKELSLRDVMEFKAGDVIPVELPEYLVMRIEDLPSYRCKLGKVQDNLALQIMTKIARPETVKTELQLVTHKNKSKNLSEI
ncbi:FliM/FliN family flagellar motor switch protein [Shewanella dokdonensis]